MLGANTEDNAYSAALGGAFGKARAMLVGERSIDYADIKIALDKKSSRFAGGGNADNVAKGGRGENLRKIGYALFAGYD